MPVATTAEASGTFVNGKGLSQAFSRAVKAPLGITAGWETLGEIAVAAGKDLAWKKLPEVRAAMPALPNGGAAAGASAGAGA